MAKRGVRSGATHAIEPLDHDAELLDIYIDELRRLPVLSAEDQKVLARRMRNSRLGTAERTAAREQLITANLRFAFSIAKKYQQRGLPLEDLVSEANAGLCRAADKYDPDVGVNFISYAVWWIRQAIFAALTTKTRTVRLPLNRAGDVTRIARARAVLRRTLDREPTVEEVAEVSAVDVEVVRSLDALIAPERSLDEPVGGRHGDDGPSLASVLPLDTEEQADAVWSPLEEDSRRQALRRALEPLPPRDRKVIVLYYGLEGGEPMTLSEIAGMLGVTRERVRQLRDRALAAIRKGEGADVLRGDWAA